MRMTIRAKLLSSFFLILVLLVTVGIIALVKMNALQNTTMKVQGNWLPSIIQIEEMKGNVSEIRVLLHQIILDTDKEVIQTVQKSIAQNKDNLLKLQKAYEPLLNTPEEKEIYATFNEDITAYLEQSNKVIQLASINENKQAYELLTQMRPLRVELWDDMSKWVSFNTNGAKKEVDQAIQDNRSGSTLILLFGIIALIAGIGMRIAALVQHVFLCQIDLVGRFQGSGRGLEGTGASEDEGRAGDVGGGFQ